MLAGRSGPPASQQKPKQVSTDDGEQDSAIRPEQNGSRDGESAAKPVATARAAATADSQPRESEVKARAVKKISSVSVSAAAA